MEGASFLFMAGLLVGVFLSSVIWNTALNNFKQQAINSGVAEYSIVDPATGSTKFGFKTIKQ